MLFNAVLSAAALSSLAYAADIQIMVGAGGNQYSQTSVTAAVGDTVSFHFTGTRHDVVQAAFDTPCAPLAGGFQVEPQTSSDAIFTIAVKDTNPIFYYCSVATHCQNGMVGVINPSSSQDYAGFSSKASNANSGSQPSGISGGLLVQGSSTVGGSLATSPASSGSASSSAGASSTSAKASASSSGSVAGSSSSAGAMGTAVPAAFAVLVGAVAGLL